MANVYELVREHRAALLARERASASKMVAAYTDVWAAIKAEQDKLLAKIKTARANGEDVSVGWLLREERLEALLSQARGQLSRFAEFAGGLITDQQRQAVAQALANAREHVLQTAHSIGLSVQWNALPTGAVENLVGVLHDGSPVVDALKKRFGIVEADAAKKAEKVETALTKIRQAFVTGVARGSNPREIAREVADAGAMPLDKALVFSRTEVLRSYREATRTCYQENADVVRKWRWVATLTARSCCMCIAQHGTLHDLDEPFGTHPNCRCVQVPVIVGQEDADFRSGEEWFAAQEESVQDDMLGKAAGAAYRAGQVSLPDFVHEKKSEKWGLTRRVASLTQALENAST